MKGNLSKTKLTRIVMCTLMVAAIFQVTAISMVQATSESVDDTVPKTLIAEDFVRIDNDNQQGDFVKPEDGSDLGITTIAEPLEILPENGEFISTDDQPLDFVKPEDDSDLGITLISGQENNQALIGAKTTSETGSPIMAGAAMLVVFGAIGIVFVAVGHKKTK